LTGGSTLYKCSKPKYARKQKCDKVKIKQKKNKLNVVPKEREGSSCGESTPNYSPYNPGQGYSELES